MTKENGGPAFPQHILEPNPNGGEPRIVWQEGMTLRDYFAAKAMREMTWMNKEGSARECYEMADAMLEARKQ